MRQKKGRQDPFLSLGKGGPSEGEDEMRQTNYEEDGTEGARAFHRTRYSTVARSLAQRTTTNGRGAASK